MGRLYIYLHLVELCMVNVGKYASPMDPMRYKHMNRKVFEYLLITSNPQELLFVGVGAMKKTSFRMNFTVFESLNNKETGITVITRAAVSLRPLRGCSLHGNAVK